MSGQHFSKRRAAATKSCSDRWNRCSPTTAVEMRFFGGMEIQQVADVLQVSPDTVKRDWRLAKLWLARELGREEGNGA